MAFFSFLSDSSGIRGILAHDPTRYGPIRELRENIMRRPSSLSTGERELVMKYPATRIPVTTRNVSALNSSGDIAAFRP